MRLAKRVTGIDESVTLAITSRAKKMVGAGIDVVSLAAGEPDFDTPEIIKEAAIKAIKSGFTKYTPSSGIPELREAISRKFKNDNLLEYAPSQIVVSNGAKHSLYNIFQVLCDPQDEVIIPAPYWLSYPAMASLAQAKSVFVHANSANNFKMTSVALEEAITPRTKCLIINSPSNPTGAMYSEDELREIAAVAVKHKIFVISDEIYEKLIYDGQRHVSIASLGNDIYDLTITVNGVSKSCSMTGWRIGYAAGPADIMQAIGCLQSHATSNPSSISQKAAVAALTQDLSFIDKVRSEYQKRRDYMASRIKGMKNISCFTPQGAFYLFCDISATGRDSIVIANALLDEAKVAVIPGSPFGSDNYIRLSFATSMTKIESGMNRIEEWLKKNG